MERQSTTDPERERLMQAGTHEQDWKLWGPYLSERQWATVREDYSQDGNCWDYFPHDMAPKRAYRWGEDGLLGISDRLSRLCFSLALWNGKDPILKERLFGVTGPQGNHGEDCKEEYFYLDSSPTHSYLKGLYKYPQNEYPYKDLVETNKKRGLKDEEYELCDTGALDNDAYFDVQAEYAKESAEDVLIRITVSNRGKERAPIWVLPTFWARNTWSWGAHHEGNNVKPLFNASRPNSIRAQQVTMGRYTLDAEPLAPHTSLPMLFTENESNHEMTDKAGELVEGYFKDAFHHWLIKGEKDRVNGAHHGTKSAFVYALELDPGESRVIRLRLYAGEDKEAPFHQFDDIVHERVRETDAFYETLYPERLPLDERLVMRQAYAGLLWTKQFYYYVVKEWMRGDSLQPSPPTNRAGGRNAHWTHLHNRDIISMPDKWEYPWYAAWDLAFHMVPFASVDQHFAQEQLVLFLREWYMHPNGQIPAYEFEFGAVNPPVHAWACMKVYENSGPAGWRDRTFLSRVFHKLLINFTWWVNRTDIHGKNLFAGGFLGLDNIGVFDRGATLPSGGVLEQADGTAWIGFYAGSMLQISLELAKEDRSYSDVASKFFEHFLTITDAMNSPTTGLWDEEDGFYYDKVRMDKEDIPMRIRSMVGLIPLFAVTPLEEKTIDLLPGFRKRMNWFLQNKEDLASHLIYSHDGRRRFLLSLLDKASLRRVFQYMFDENEFLSPYGLRSLSKFHENNPYIFKHEGEEHRVDYAPGNSQTVMFGGNSNWRGPIWFPLNYLIIESLLEYYQFFGDDFTVEYPTKSGNYLTLDLVAVDLCERLSRLFLKDDSGQRPFWGERDHSGDENWENHILFHEFFHGDSGKGLGASHQTGWTALVIKCLEKAHAVGAKKRR